MNIYFLIHNVLCFLVFVQQYTYTTSYYHDYDQSIITLRPPKLPADAYFGYSVAYVPTYKRLIAGAPNIFEFGEIFECELFNNTCIKNSPTIITLTHPTKTSEGFWLGAAVEAGSNFYVVCAPRAATALFNIKQKVNLEGTAGLCFVRDLTKSGGDSWITLLTTENRTKSFKPFFMDEKQDSFGWSISVLNNSILIGGPAISTGRTSFYGTWTSKPQIKLPEALYNYGRTSFYGTWTSKPQIKLPEALYNYGYAVLMRPVGNTIQYLVSSTHGVKGAGDVTIGRITNNSLKDLAPRVTNKDKIGSTYGTVLRLIKHGNQEYLLVGAPSYSAQEYDRYDLGCVYVYIIITKGRKKYQHHITIEGKHAGGHFGHSIVNIGDLNVDGTEDVAISAPFEDHGKGAVYIYSGIDIATKLSEKVQAIQRIQRADAVYLGLSMTAMSNLDDNGCSSLGMGAPGKDEVIVLHCIPSVTINLDVETLPNLQARRYAVSDKVNETYFSFSWCFNIIYPDKLNLVELDLLAKVRLLHKYAKLVYNGEDKQDHDVIVHNITVREKKKQVCKETTINLPDAGHYEEPLLLSITAKQTNDPRLNSNFIPFHVIVSNHSVLSFGPRQVWAIECKNQKACEPKLKANVNTTISPNYAIGSTEEETIFISIINNNSDTAYHACAKVIINGVKTRPPTDCKVKTANEWICRYPAPLRNMTKWTINPIILEMSSLTSKTKEISYEVQIQNDCITTSDTTTGVFPLRNDAERVKIRGTKNFESLVYIRDNQPKQVNHKYEIINNGSTNWVDLKFTLKLTKQKYIDDYSSSNLQLSSDGSTIPVNCEPLQSSESTDVMCTIESLNKGQIITVSLDITVSTTRYIENNVNISVDTSLSLSLDESIKTKSVQTLLRIEKLIIPIWIIIVSVLSGLMLFAIMVFIMYKSGCFERKDKTNLKELRSSVRRQTIRQSESEAFKSTKKSEMEPIVNDEDQILDDGLCEIIDSDDTMLYGTAGTSTTNNTVQEETGN